VISFYHDFRRVPPGRRVIRICRAEACQAVGCEALVDHVARSRGLAIDSTSADGAVTFETVYCLGNCALGPAALVDGELVGRLTDSKLEALCAGRAA
jgi:formate dehydrogenase subunit gamma